jgi:hypothetical protein
MEEKNLTPAKIIRNSSPLNINAPHDDARVTSTLTFYVLPPQLDMKEKVLCINICACIKHWRVLLQ